MPRSDCPVCGSRTGSGYVCPKCEPGKYAEVERKRVEYCAAESRTEALRVPATLQCLDALPPSHRSPLTAAPL